MSVTLFLSVMVACGTSETVPEEVLEPEKEMFSLRIEFGEDGNASWFPLNDDVMGGVSTSSVQSTDKTLIFSGEVSTDNNGGFVSLRSPNREYELEDYTQVEVSYKSSGQDFMMILADHAAWYMPEFRHEVLPTSEEWTTVTIPLSDFTQYKMTNFGEIETDEELTANALSEVIRIELRNSVFTDGDFQLELDYIEFQGFEE
ncbi:MAG: hypothetical protein CL916_14875 [Deltaproteobacteria bacterium]|nr:hypothetical protein [Deltaproteobacteria bacterium]